MYRILYNIFYKVTNFANDFSKKSVKFETEMANKRIEQLELRNAKAMDIINKNHDEQALLMKSIRA